MEILVIGAFIGLIPAAIAQSKGYSFILWWFFGTLLFIVALPAALLMRPNIAAIEQNKLHEGMKKCPFCAELIRQEANVCKHCGRELNHASSSEITPINTPTQATQKDGELSWDATNREAAERFTAEKGIAVCNVVPKKRDVPTIQPPAFPKNFGLPLAMALLAIVGIVIGQVISSVGNRTKMTFDDVVRQLDSSTQSATDVPMVGETKLTLANFDRIRTGMDRYEVGDILGFGWRTVAENEFGQGTEFHVTTEMLEWQDGFRVVNCMFQNGKLVQKAQAGLR